MTGAVAGGHRLVRSTRGGVPGSAVRAVLAAGDWRCERVLPTVSDTAVVMVRAYADQACLLKVAVSARGADSLRRERAVLTMLGADEILGDWRGLIPVPLSGGTVGTAEYLLTSRLPGRDGRRLPQQEAGALTRAAFAAIAPLHRHARDVVAVDAALLDAWIERPAAVLRVGTRTAGRPIGWATEQAVGAMVAALRAGLAGSRVSLGWTHGDFHPGNVLTSTDGQVTGLVDWDQAAERDITAADLAFWLLTGPAPGRRREFGARVAARLRRRECWTPAEARLLGLAAGEAAAAGRGLLLLAWLRHVAGNLGKSDRYATSPLWLRRNVRPVLRQVADG